MRKLHILLRNALNVFENFSVKVSDILYLHIKLIFNLSLIVKIINPSHFIINKLQEGERNKNLPLVIKGN